MISLEFDYVHFLCMNLIATNERFAKAYSLKLQNISQKREIEFYYEEELVSFMIKALRQGNKINYLDYNKFDKLYAYISDIFYLQDKYMLLIRKARNKRISLYEDKNEPPELSDYVFEDSYFLKFEVNHKKEICRCFFHNVLLYGDRWKKGIYDVEAVDLVLNFTGVKHIELKGSFDFEFLRGNRVYSSNRVRLADNSYSLALLCIAYYEHFIIEITFSRVSAEEFSYDSCKIIQ